MSSLYSGTSNLLQSPSMKCFDDYPMKKMSHKRETKVHIWTYSVDEGNRGSQETPPSKRVVP